MIIAIIPARSGSKRIKKKNIKSFYSKSMIYWAIKRIKESELFDFICVSYDSNEILNIAKKYGVEILIKRPKTLADDNTPTKPVIKHAIKELEKRKIRFDTICCVYPCNPFIFITDLKKAFKIVRNISIFPMTNKTTNVVKDFYYEEPFPNYNDNDSKFTLLDKGDKNLFINSLKKEIKYGKIVLEAGSGTSQLSIYLAIGTNNQIYGLDGSLRSLELASKFVIKIDE